MQIKPSFSLGLVKDEKHEKHMHGRYMFNQSPFVLQDFSVLT